MRPIDRIIVHTNGSPGKKVWQIRAYHMLKGWRDIGYHWVIYEDGTIHPGRPEKLPGAHVEGLNQHTLGVCFIGNGDKAPLTADQLRAGALFLAKKCTQFRIKPTDVLGHRETTHLVPPALATHKTCPGTQVSMNELRQAVAVRYDMISRLRDLRTQAITKSTRRPANDQKD
jgi:N-acetylmuramoyl-L-alanine amidase